MERFEIAEVTMLRRRAGERITESEFTAFAVKRPNFEDEDGPALAWESVFDPIIGVYKASALPCDWAGLRFRFVGSGFGVHYLSNIEADHDEAGAEEALGDWAEDLITIGDGLLQAERDGLARHDVDTVTFLTLWEDMTTVDYEGEVGVSYTLLGLIDPAKLRLTLKEKQ